MNTSLTNYPINPNINYWVANPQMRFIPPFSKLYTKDKGGDYSSTQMYVITFMCEPDEQENKFFRMSEDVRQHNLKQAFPSIKWEDPLFVEALEAYPFECLDTIQRSLKEELESIKTRAKLISETPYTLDDYMRDSEGDYIYDKTGKPIPIKGTSKQLDDMRKSTAKIYDDLNTTISKYMVKKTDEIRVRGGRKETLHERGLIALTPFLILLSAI